MKPDPRLTQLTEALQDPRAYPHNVAKIHVLQTHVSCVFLTGEHVYKIKKPVNFGFIDYSSLDRRREFCEKELLLNRRLCPEIYLNVTPITESGGRLQVDGSGPVVEWAVHMRQLRGTDMLSARIQSGRVTQDQIHQVARILAAFHDCAATDPVIAGYGRFTGVSRAVLEALPSRDLAVERILPDTFRTAIERYWASFLDSAGDLLQTRIDQGRIRECHGDLRTQNICFDARYNGGIQIFDCVEFNDELRCIDVASDLAYLAMDLDLSGRADLRSALIDTYAAVTRDPDLGRMLAFYRCYRACVRAKISLLAAREEELDEQERQAHRDTAMAALDLAAAYACRRKRPALWITIGFSGSGKTALAHELARRLPAVYIASDRVRREMVNDVDGARLGAAAYTPQARSAVYREMRVRANRILARGDHVILDATFLDESERMEAAGLALRAGAEFWMLEVKCRDAVIRERLEHRARDGTIESDAGVLVYEKQLQSYETPGKPCAPGLPIVRHLIRDGEKPSALSSRETLAEFMMP